MSEVFTRLDHGRLLAGEAAKRGELLAKTPTVVLISERRV
jgi:hypothetical protein